MGQHLRRRLGAIALVCLIALSTLPHLVAAQTALTEPVKLFMVAIGDEGHSGPRIGCGDSLIPVNIEIPGSPTTEGKITQALTHLFGLHSPEYGASGLVNALHASNLTVDDIELQGNTAAIYLSGTVILGGTCDQPRVEEQIAAVARQFPGVSKAVIIVNGGPIDSAIGSIFFPETGYRLEDPFYDYWERNGGLPIFGYPLTPQLVENGYRTQYFERQRFEHHPENDTPYNVLFGLVGTETAARRGLLGTPPFAPKPASGAAACEYAAPTSHNLCGEFRTYWHRYGLDFGEPGVSARESLALFGFPISEPFEERLEDGQIYTVQYFERVRMEIHPENPPAYRILLGRLTADLIP